jgi:pimeloyl-ACP methyl ester carboxylesterase
MLQIRLFDALSNMIGKQTFTYKLFAGADHMPQIKKPEEFVKYVVEFPG